MTIHPQARAFADLVEGAPPLDTLTVEQNRRDLSASVPMTGPTTPLPVVEDRRIAGVGVRIYSPRPFAEDLPVVVYFHGGGWVLGDLEIADTTARDLAAGADAAVINVDYRLAPEHVFPAAVEDAVAVTQAVLDGSAGIQLDSTRVAVAGDSAGGNLAAVVAQQLAPTYPGLVHQALIYPATTGQVSGSGSYREYDEHYFLSTRTMAYFYETYAPGVDPSDFRLAPIANPNLRGLPSATILNAELDPLRDDGLAYAAALAAAGVPVNSVVFVGQVHPFFYMAGAIDAAFAARRFIGGELRAAFELASQSRLQSQTPGGTP